MKRLFTLYSVLFFLFFLIAFPSCKKDADTTPPADLGYNYFPDAVGTYAEYEVDSTWQDDKSLIDTLYRYLLREEIMEVFTDNEGRPTLKIHRYFKYYNPLLSYDSIPWSAPRVWYANKTATTAEKVEENARYIKLIFPAKEGKEWDGNTFNAFGQKEYEIISVDEPGTVGSLMFDSVVTVMQYKQIDFIQYRHEEERFARNIGLIYKVRDSLYDGGGIDTVGYTYKQKIIAYGK